MRSARAGGRIALPVGQCLSVLLCLGLLAGCSWIKNPDAATPPTSSPSANTSGGPSGGPSSDDSVPMTTASPTALPTAFLQSASTRFPEEDVLDAATGDDVVLTLTSTTITARSLPDLDTAYSLSSEDGDFTDVWTDPAAGEGYALEAATDFGDGTTVGEDQYTLQRFDLETGEIADVAIATLPQDSLSSANRATAQIATVEGDVVILDSWVPETEGAHTALALDLADETLLWDARPALVLTVTSDLVIVNTGSPDDVGRIQALDLETGDRRWSSLPGTLGASAIGTSADAVVIARDDNVFPDASITRLRLEDGKPGKPQTTDAWDWSCAPTSGSVAVCTLADGLRSRSDRVVGWDMEQNEPAWQLPTSTRFAPIVTVVAHDLVYGLLDSGQGVVLDAITGEDVAGATGAGPMAVNDYGGVLLYSGTAIFLPSGTPESSESASTSPSP